MFINYFVGAKPGSGQWKLFKKLGHFSIDAVGFIIVPVICVILGKFVTGAFVERYAVIAITGFSLLVAFIAAKLNNNNALIALLSVICFVGWFGFLRSKNIWRMNISQPESKVQLLKLNDVNKDLPIVAADPWTAIDLDYHAPELRSRVVYLADPEISMRRLSTNSVERGMIDLLKPWFGLNVTDYKSYIAARQRFLLCGEPHLFSWIVPQLEEDGLKLEVKGYDGRIMLFLVSPANADTIKAP